ncbi:MAG: hypothetical protein AVDCRST_MAG77-5912 [uncultured Chloroflexi bacterium]|uniref:Uncharacterized protein n=1 Tax=uncultured Chloroflexota bacterium TaxID=166587 RepID=A0A6J4KHW8_9CHLR|nr:MAG: hypothetical protein AVDCRST_MAG77-5912 [uncultured Chloroflexota bacterium]
MLLTLAFAVAQQHGTPAPAPPEVPANDGAARGKRCVHWGNGWLRGSVPDSTAFSR